MRYPRNGNHQTQTWKSNRNPQNRKFLFNLRTPMTWKLKLNFWPLSTMPSKSMIHATLTRKSNQPSEMLLKLPVLDSFWPATASRMSESFSWLLTASFKTQPALPTTSSFLSSFTFWADKDTLTAKNSSTSFFDCMTFEFERINLIFVHIHFFNKLIGFSTYIKQKKENKTHKQIKNHIPH